jgi:membrane associated rhomboid family serine protease
MGSFCAPITILSYSLFQGSNKSGHEPIYESNDIASIAQIVVNPNSTVPSLGASGAIAGVRAAYLVLFPWARVKTVIFIFIFFTIVNLPAIVLIGIWFLLQFFSGIAALSTVQQSMGGVAYLAHVGGFVAGLLITLLLRDRLRPPADVSYPYFPHHPNTMDQAMWR